MNLILLAPQTGDAKCDESSGKNETHDGRANATIVEGDTATGSITGSYAKIKDSPCFTVLM